MFNRHHNEIVFIKCKDKSCCADFRSQELFDILKSWVFKVLAATLDETCQNHYNTFIQESSAEKKLLGDDGQPSVLKTDVRSFEHCKSYGLTSNTEKQRQRLYFIVDRYKINFLYKNQDYLILSSIILYYLFKLYSMFLSLIYSF